MNDFGADKNCVIVVSLDGENYLTDDKGFVYVFSTYREIKDWARSEGYNYEELFLHEVQELSDDDIEEIEF